MSPLFKDWATTVHFAANPAVGGMPANMAIIEIRDHWFIFDDKSFVFSFTLDSMSIFTTIYNETQYSTINETMDFDLTVVASIIQLRLKIDDNAITSIIVFALICEALPTTALSKAITTTTGFNINVRR